jgi:hypothetical protein
MDELGTLRARREKQARAVARLEREVTALRDRGKARASLEALEGVLSRHRETLRRLSAELDAADPKPPPCPHTIAVRVELSTGELAAWLCPDCDQQLPPEWSLPREEEPQLPAGFWETLAGQQIARRVEQLPEADRGYLRTPPEPQ